MGPVSVTFRRAEKSDMPIILGMETSSFPPDDQISSRSFLNFIQSTKADFIVMIKNHGIIGYGIVLFKKGSSLARLYSMAVSEKYRGHGYGKKLLKSLEDLAKERNCAYMRLEVSGSNRIAKNLFKKSGHSIFEFKEKEGLLDQNQDALCFEKKLISPSSHSQKVNLDYYEQTTDFTCGPASLMMAMNCLKPEIKMKAILELQIWREATTIFMLSGHGGCGPRGLALAAHRRGFRVELYLNAEEYYFLESVRDPKKKQIMKIVQRDFEQQMADKDIPIKRRKSINFELIEKIFHRGGIPVVLISTYQLNGKKVPHWVVVSGIDEKFIYFHDPDVDDDQRDFENQNIPVRKDEFDKMCRYGAKQLQSVVVLFAPEKMV